MITGSLVVIGSGIKFIAHLTHEAKAYIQQSDRVLYLVNDPLMQQWLGAQNAHAESLDNLYLQANTREEAYQTIAEYVLEAVRSPAHVCFVLYGHPTVFAQPGLEAVRRAKGEGYYAKILPAISAEACLFADLLIDPGSVGCQSFEATDFLVYQRPIHPFSHLILWQVDAIGIKDHSNLSEERSGIKILIEQLMQVYSRNHLVAIYEAAQYPGFEPRIEWCQLHELFTQTLSRISTVYVPPQAIAEVNKKIVAALN